MDADQRTVLAHMREESLLLDGDDGWKRLMQSMRGGGGPRDPKGPKRQISGYECRNNKITAHWSGGGGPTVITRGDINKYRRILEPELLQQLSAARAAYRAENTRTYAWCWCPQQRGEGKCFGRAPYLPKPYHPTDAETDEHYRIVHRLQDELREALRAALHLGHSTPVTSIKKHESDPSPAPAGMLFTVERAGDQLEMF